MTSFHLPQLLVHIKFQAISWSLVQCLCGNSQPSIDDNCSIFGSYWNMYVYIACCCKRQFLHANSSHKVTCSRSGPNLLIFWHFSRVVSATYYLTPYKYRSNSGKICNNETWPIVQLHWQCNGLYSFGCVCISWLNKHKSWTHYPPLVTSPVLFFRRIF